MTTDMTNAEPTIGSVFIAGNPTAGGGTGAAQLAKALAAFEAAEQHVLTLEAKSAGELRDVIAERVTSRDALVVVGGDGTVNLAINAVAGSNIALGIVAAGSGNDMARSLGLPVGNIDQSVQRIVESLHGQRLDLTGIDLLDVSGPDLGQRWCGGSLAAGFDAVVNARANSWATLPLGKARYVLATLRELPELYPRDYDLRLDGVSHQISAQIVVVANAAYYGGGMQIAPEAVLSDGYCDVLWAEPLSTMEFLRLMVKVRKGEHISHPKVHYHRAQSVDISTADLVIYGDGEPLARTPLSVRSVPHSVYILGARVRSRPSTVGM